MGQGTAVLGMGISGKTLVQAANAQAKATPGTEKSNGKYQIFQPGEYYDWEKDIIEERFALAKNGPKKGGGGPGGPGGPGGKPSALTEAEILNFNRKWDPHNPLFTDMAYARKAGHPSIPAFPSFQTPMGGHMLLTIPIAWPDIWLFAHGPNDIRYFRHIYAGDIFTSETDKLFFEDITTPGADFRHLKMGSIAKMYDQKGELVAQSNDWLRNGYKKIIDGSPVPSYTEVFSRTIKDLPEGHYTTDEEWEYIKELWRKEEIRGDKKLFWEDVKIGDEPPWTCSGPITYMDMVGWYGGSPYNLRDKILKGDTKHIFRDRFGQYLPGVAGMFGSRNMVGARMTFYNDTAAKHITRTITNYIGDAGLVTRIGWMFQQSHIEMRYPREGGEYLDKVPYMKGKACTVHGSEGDTVIGKAYVTDKYKNEKGEGIIDIVGWGETLDDRIVEVVPASVKLPLKKG